MFVPMSELRSGKVLTYSRNPTAWNQGSGRTCSYPMLFSVCSPSSVYASPEITKLGFSLCILNYDLLSLCLPPLDFQGHLGEVRLVPNNLSIFILRKYGGGSGFKQQPIP